MKRVLISLLVTVSVIILLSCNGSDNISGPSFSQLDNLRNVPWVLTGAKVDGASVDLTSLLEFHFLLGDSLVYGDDGCNAYHGPFLQDQDSVQIVSLSKTLVACRPNQFDPYTLVGKWRLAFSTNSISLQHHSTLLVFTSKFSRPLSEYPFVNKTWTLSASNDTSFGALKALNLLPTLYLSSNREYSLKWYYAPRNRYFPSNNFGGAYGVGPNWSITFYNDQVEYGTPDSLSSNEDLQLVFTIIGSQSFWSSSNILILVNSATGHYYQFAPNND